MIKASKIRQNINKCDHEKNTNVTIGEHMRSIHGSQTVFRRRKNILALIGISQLIQGNFLRNIKKKNMNMKSIPIRTMDATNVILSRILRTILIKLWQTIIVPSHNWQK